MEIVDPRCAELVLWMRYKQLSKDDQQKVTLLINLLSGHLKIATADDPLPDFRIEIEPIATP